MVEYFHQGLPLVATFSIHNIINLEIEGPDNSFTRYCLDDLQFFRTPTLPDTQFDLLLKVTETGADLSAQPSDLIGLGGGLFYSNESDTALVSTSRSNTDPRRAAISIENYTMSSDRPVKVQVRPGIHTPSTLRQIRSAWKRQDPRSPLAREAERFFSQAIEPLIYRLMLRRGALLAHVAGLTKGSQTALLFGVRNVGKTSTSLALCRSGWTLLGDDFCVLGPDGVALAYPKMLKLEVDHVGWTEDVKAAFELASSGWRQLLAQASRKVRARQSFEIKVPPQALATTSVGGSGKPTVALFLERSVHNDGITVEPIHEDEAAHMAVSHVSLEFGVLKRWNTELIHSIQTLAGTHHGVLENEHQSLEAILHNALEGVTSFRLLIGRGGPEEVAGRVATLAGSVEESSPFYLSELDIDG